MRVAAGLLLLAVPAVAQAADGRASVDLPAGPLGRALAALSRQGDVDIGVDDPALQALPVRAVHGRMRVADALDRLLRETPAMWLRGPGGSFRVVRRPPPASRAALPTPVVVRDAAIIVTGSKRAAPLADYPATVTIVRGDALEPGGAPAGSDAIAARVASVGSTHFGPGRNKLFVRGIIDSGFTGPSEATTGQYLDNARLNYNGPDPNLRLHDVAAVEVLEGPQGTLYGAGSLGGVIHIVTARPELDRFLGNASGGVSATAHGDPGGDLAGVLNLPLVRDRAALRLVGYGEREGGYIDAPAHGVRNINGVTTIGGRATLRVRLGDWTVDLGGVGQSIDADDSQWTDGDGAALLRAGRIGLGYRDRYLLGSATVQRHWGEVQFVSSLAAVRQRVAERYDAGDDVSGFLVTQRTDTTMLASETRLSRRGADGTGWVAGLSLIDNDSRLERIGVAPDGGTTPRERAANRVREATVFGEAGVSLFGGVIATGGLRLTAARVRGDARVYREASTIPIFGSPQSVAGTHAELRALPSAALSGKPWPGVLVFARYQQGFRPGGFGVSGITGRSYAGDHIDTVEAGARAAVPGTALDLAATASWSWWRDILAEVVSRGGDPLTTNIGDGEIGAVEARLGWRPRPAFELHAGLFWNHSRLTRPTVTSVVVRGDTLPNVPRIGVQAGARFDHALSGGLRASVTADLRYYGGSRIGAGPVLDAAQGNYLDDRIAVRVGDARRGLSLQVTNIQDSAADRFAFGTPYRIYDAQATPQQPRTIRFGFDATF